MKGLILKDLYMMKKYCKSYLFIAAAFIALSMMNDNNMFFLFYPCLLCGIIPVNLLSYDERDKWLGYSRTLPYTKAQIVSSKYLIGLFAQAAMIIITGVAQGIKLNITGAFESDQFVVMMLMLFVMSTITSSISLPFMFKLGVEKGRMAYYIMIGIICAGSVIASRLLRTEAPIETDINRILPVLSFVGVGLYIFSWYLSIVFFQKREI